METGWGTNRFRSLIVRRYERQRREEGVCEGQRVSYSGVDSKNHASGAHGPRLQIFLPCHSNRPQPRRWALTLRARPTTADDAPAIGPIQCRPDRPLIYSPQPDGHSRARRLDSASPPARPELLGMYMHVCTSLPPVPLLHVDSSIHYPHRERRLLGRRQP